MSGVERRDCERGRRGRRNAEGQTRIGSFESFSLTFEAARENCRRVVQTFVEAALDLRHVRAFRGVTGSELVGYYALWTASLLSEQPRQQKFRGYCVAANLGNFVEDVAVLIDGAP